MEFIKVENLNFGYTDDLVIEDLNLTIKQGELSLLTGANGSGKSTLVKLILGELKADSGTIEVEGEEVQSKKKFLEIGYVPQMNVMGKIAFPVTCKELISLGLYDDWGLIKIPKKRHIEKTKKMLEDMDLLQYENTPFNELSGGLQQRVLISRAMINEPKVLLMDEPTAGVDQKNKERFLGLINEVNRKYKIPMILVTHEIELVKDYLEIDYIYKMENGRCITC